MKGFPNQVANLPTLTKAVRIIAELLKDGKNPKDDGVYGEILVRTGVLGTGHQPIPVEEYLAKQKSIAGKSNQSFRTRARGLRELFRVLGLIDQSAASVKLTSAGQQIVGFDETLRGREWLHAWRNVILNMTHDGGDGVNSHPYQVLLRLVANRPGISRAKCALALEAKDDSEAELSRIADLSDLTEIAILSAIRETKSNWDNAKKILPHFAEQLGDVRKVGQNFYLAVSPGDTVPATQPARARRTPSVVTAQTIATTRTVDEWDESLDDPRYVAPDQAAMAERRRKINDRFNRHQAVVKKAALLLGQEGAELSENPYDCFARFTTEALLLEVKSLDGTSEDEVDRVREALSQLLYYQAFATVGLAEGRLVKKVACFESKISDAHTAWLAANDIRVIWLEQDTFKATPAVRTDLSGHFGF